LFLKPRKIRETFTFGVGEARAETLVYRIDIITGPI